MTDSKPKYANFPERDLKVVLGANIGTAILKTLTRMSIGTYEMSFLQQEKGKATNDAVKTAMKAHAKTAGLTVTHETSREFIGVTIAQNADLKIQVWVTTPFELTQANHIIWARYTELTGDQKTGVSFKLATAFSADDVSNLIKAAIKNAVVVPPGEPYVLKGNPPPRFQKKVPVTEAAPAVADPADVAAADA